jgi:4-aminobutyrate aminotransferase/diaminobutyrate-pyruvate transaminase/4-aminobutyrate aminotransferase/(S)-3-amino-2-methylpropionate transaminase
MAKQFAVKPRKTEPVETKYRRIVTAIPAPGSIPLLKRLRKAEPVSMTGQPPIVWSRAKGFKVHDKWGNKWLDWSSGVLVASAGHGRKKIIKAMREAMKLPLLHNYCFPSEYRARLVNRLVKLAPKGLDRCFLLTTGSEGVECIIKNARAHGQRVGGPEKTMVVTFNGDFHGRTMASQLAGGSPALKEWIGPTRDRNFVQVDFPGNIRTADPSFEGFIRALEAQGATAANICLVMPETYQGGSAAFLPVEFARQLRKWCTANKVVLAFDEVQAGFGRCGTMWGFEYYGVVPDIFCLGKGISSSMPLSAVVGKPAIMDQFPPNSMTSTHTGNPICCAAALASIDLIVKEKLVGKAARMGAVLHAGLNRVREKYPENIAGVQGRGMVAGVHMVKPGTDMDPDPEAAFDIIERCFEKGLLMFAPVGVGGGTIKIAPPLVTPKAAVEDGLAAFQEAVTEVIGG